MKTSCHIFILLFCMGAAGCKDDRSELIADDNPCVRTLCLPVTFDPESHENEKIFSYPKDKRDSLFLNKELFPENVRIARLPQRDSIQTVLTYTGNSPEKTKVKVYTFNEENGIKDSMTLFSSEELETNHLTLEQTFYITENYRFKVCKHLNGVLIEQLYYRIDENGYFQEVRDGITPAIAYESPDDIHYKVESFIWDYDKNNGLYRKDLETVSYEVKENRDIIRTPSH